MKTIDDKFIDEAFESFISENANFKQSNEYSLTESVVVENEKYGLNTYTETGNFNIDEESYKNFLIEIM